METSRQPLIQVLMLDNSKFDKHSKYIVRNSSGALELCELVELDADDFNSNVTHHNTIGEYIFWSQCVWTESQTFDIVRKAGYVVDKLQKEWRWGSLGQKEAISFKSLNWDISFKCYLDQFEAAF